MNPRIRISEISCLSKWKLKRVGLIIQYYNFNWSQRVRNRGNISVSGLASSFSLIYPCFALSGTPKVARNISLSLNASMLCMLCTVMRWKGLSGAVFGNFSIDQLVTKVTEKLMALEKLERSAEKSGSGGENWRTHIRAIDSGGLIELARFL